MKLKVYLVQGHYHGKWKEPVEFTVEAINPQMAKSFVFAYIPGFTVESVQFCVAKAEQHYSFSVVNAAVSARFHRQNRQRYGCAVRSQGIRQMRDSHRLTA